MKRTARYNRKYVPSLDGLRALAVLAVIGYHLNFSWAKGGFIGVDIFFVLSGYLITNILLTQWDKENTIHLKDFWLRRFRRLIPAAYLMIVVVVIFAVLFQRDLLTTLRGDAAASFLYVSNWWFIFHNVSYFDAFGLPSPLKNLWTLAIEEQFYLIWPLFLFVFLRWIKNPKLLIRIILVIAVISAILMGIIYTPGSDPSRVYYGTDTRLFNLLIGCALAFAWPFNRLSPQVPRASKVILNLSGGFSLICLLLFIVYVSEYQAFLYRGGLFIVTLLAAVLIATTSHPSSFLSKILSFKALRWIGTRSYGIYLWHYPVITLTTPVTEIGMPSIIRALLQVAATFIIAELSFRFIETPIRKTGFIAYIKNFRHYNYFKYQEKPIGKWLAIAGLASILIIFSIGMSGVLPVKSNAERTATAVKTHVDKAQNTQPEQKKQPKDVKKPAAKQESQKANKENKQSTDDKKSAVVKSHEGTIDYKQTLAIGDSVMIDIEPYLKSAVPNITIDGKIGRQLTDAISIAANYTKFNSNDSAIILELGTNGPFTAKQLNRLLNKFNKAHIYLVNTRVPRGWESSVNDMIQKASARNNVTLIDWYREAINHSSYFARDGVHLTTSGAEAYITMLTNAMKKN